MGFLKKHTALMVVVIDIVLVAYFWFYYAPILRRPFEVLLVLLAVLGTVTAFVAKRNAVRGVFIVLVAVCLSLFALEMCQKYFNIINAFSTVDIRAADNAGDPYAWKYRNPASYLKALTQARADGVDPGTLESEHFPRDIFLAGEKESLVSYHDRLDGGSAFKKFVERDQVLGPPLGFRLVPDRKIWEYVTAAPDEVIIHDGLAQIDSAGIRSTPGIIDSTADCYLFLGCSFTYGLFVDDDRTLPYYFSRESGFTKQAVNLGVCGYGPNQIFLDFFLAERLERSGIGPARVKGVVYSLIDDHAKRVVMPAVSDAPYYEMENGKPVFRGSYREYMESRGTFYRMMEHSRIYPVLRQRLVEKMQAGDLGYKWRLTAALLGEIDMLCHERYNIPLSIVYWDEDPSVLRMLEDRGFSVIPVSDAFGEKWRDDARLKYFLFDYHPSAHAYELLGRHLADTILQ